jgi:hypothetical protein
LKKCDPAIPLHLLATYMGRAAVCSLRLSAHHPRQRLDKGAGICQEEEDMLFANGLQVIVYDHLAHSTKSIEGYLWHVVMQFQFEAFILVLTELVTRVEGEAIDRAWKQVNHVYENHPNLITNPRNALYYAMGNLTLKAWDKRVAAARDQRPPNQPVEPSSISKLRAQRNAKVSQITPRWDTGSIGAETQASYGYNINPLPSDTNSALDPYSQVHFPMDTADLDWEYWQNLLDGRAEPLLNSHRQEPW